MKISVQNDKCNEHFWKIMNEIKKNQYQIGLFVLQNVHWKEMKYLELQICVNMYVLLVLYAICYNYINFIIWLTK